MRKASTPRSRKISDAKLMELKDNARHILEDCRYELVKQFPFCGSVIMNMNIKPIRDRRISTAATDGNVIYFDISFLSSLTQNDRLFVLAHEVWHSILQHMLRLESRNHCLFNIASDMEVNELLYADGMFPPKTAVLPSKYGFPSGRTAEEYYEMLIDKIKKDREQQNSANDSDQQSDSTRSSNSSKSSNCQNSAIGNVTGDVNGSNVDDNVNGIADDNTNGNANGELKDQFDQHIYEGDIMDEAPGAKDIDDKYGKVGKDEDFNPEVTKNAIERIRESAVSAVQNILRERGELPGHLSRLIDQLVKPEIDWKEVLSSFVMKTYGIMTDWSQCNRRFVSSGTYLPSRKGDILNVAVGIDTSGSTCRDVQKFLSEVKGILDSVEEYQLTLIECDSEVGKFEHYTQNDAPDFKNYEMTGGGGTQLEPIFEKLRDENEQPNCAVIFTDGYTEHFDTSKDPGYPVLWVLTEDGKEDNFEFGEIVKFKSTKE